MSTCKANNFQIGQSVTATNNGTWYQPATPDGTIRYGIGNSGATTSDVVTLSSSGLSATALIPSGSTAPTNGMFLPTTNTLAWSTNSTEKMRLDASGNLGLGVTPSGWTAYRVLQIGNGSLVNYSPTQDVRLTSNGYYASGTWYYISSAYCTQYLSDGSTGKHIWYTAPSGTAGNAISFTQAMTLDASGNLLVGTTSSINGEKLSVRGGYGILCKTQYVISSTATTIAIASGCLLLLRDDANGQTALVMYENAGVPIIISQSGSNYTTGTPTGTQIKVQNRSGNVGVSAVMASGQSTTLNVCVLAVDEG